MPERLIASKRAAARKKDPATQDAEARYRRIESAAYFIAENDGFRSSATHYWIMAEQQLAAQLGEIGVWQ